MRINFQEFIVSKIQYIRSRFNERITPLIAIKYKDGVLIMAKNTVKTYRKTNCVWENKIIYGAIGEHQNIKKLTIELFTPCNSISTYLSDEDILLHWLAEMVGEYIFSVLELESMQTLQVRLLLADKNSIILIDETGTILPDEHFPHQTFVVLANDKGNEGGERRKIEKFLIDRLGNSTWKDLNFNQALKIAKEGLDVNQKPHVFYELVIINSKGSKIYNHTETLALLEERKDG